jgi:hypothetical protein
MFYLRLEVAPEPAHPHFDELGGAYVNIWVNVPTSALARQAAERILESMHWNILATESEHLVELGKYAYSEKALARIAQAEVDGDVCDFHTWPRDDGSSDAD